MAKRSTIYINDQALEALGNRKPSQVVNQTLMRMAIAAEAVEITDKMREFYRSNSVKRNSNSPFYPEQKYILREFAQEFGITSIAETIVILDKLELEIG